MGSITGDEEDELVASVVLDQEDTDPAELERTTAGLRRDLLSLEVRSIRWADGGEPDAGSRGVDPVVAGELLLTLGTSTKLLKDVVLALASWRKAQPSRTVELKIKGVSLKLEGGTAAQQDKLVEGFLRRVGKD